MSTFTAGKNLQKRCRMALETPVSDESFAGIVRPGSRFSRSITAFFKKNPEAGAPSRSPSPLSRHGPSAPAASSGRPRACDGPSPRPRLGSAPARRGSSHGAGRIVRTNGGPVFRPFRAHRGGCLFPGRRPGLACGAPLALRMGRGGECRSVPQSERTL